MEKMHYCQYLIQQKYFAKEDIYGKVFENDRIWKDFKAAYEAYAKLYKKIKGKSV